jgi:GMP synthase (glutamine-hydrolysing)
MSEPIAIVLHRQHSCPGRIGRMLRARGHRLDVFRPALGDDLPADVSAYAGVIVFGGPMSANDETPFIRREIDWIGAVLKAGLPYIGICLGAQLLAKQLGARVAHHPQGRVEIGFHPVTPTEEGRHLLSAPLQVYQWHREGFTLPRGTRLLARGTLFENQLFSYGHAAYGLQFHPEITLDIMCRLLREEEEEHGGMRPGAQSQAEQHVRKLVHGPALARWLDRFLSLWLAETPAHLHAEPGARFARPDTVLREAR